MNEIYTLQTLRPPYREAAIEALASFVKPGGTLLLIGRGRHLDEPESPPPWPMTPDELRVAATEPCLEIGNHTADHMLLDTHDPEYVAGQISLAQSYIEDPNSSLR